MQKTRSPAQAVEAAVGYAADEAGNGVAYARVRSFDANQLFRVGFRVKHKRCDAAIGYAALTTVARGLLKRGARDVRFVLGEPALAHEIATGRGVEERLVLPYVRLRCILNAFAKFEVHQGATDDLTHRARAEVALNVAA